MIEVTLQVVGVAAIVFGVISGVSWAIGVALEQRERLDLAERRIETIRKDMEKLLIEYHFKRTATKSAE